MQVSEPGEKQRGDQTPCSGFGSGLNKFKEDEKKSKKNQKGLSDPGDRGQHSGGGRYDQYGRRRQE